jgi:hypothetical protein
MPIEIRELVVRVTVGDPPSDFSIDEKKLQEIKKSIIRECSEEVLARMETKAER